MNNKGNFLSDFSFIPHHCESISLNSIHGETFEVMIVFI